VDRWENPPEPNIFTFLPHQGDKQGTSGGCLLAVAVYFFFPVTSAKRGFRLPGSNFRGLLPFATD
jgi:hypothetical protein